MTVPVRVNGASDQEERQRLLAERWRLFTHHRRHVADLLGALAGGADQRLAVLGAGACADIDLSRLSAAYGHISLLDGDGEALDDAPLLQPEVSFSTIDMHGEIDLTGLYEVFARWKRHPPDDGAVAEAMAVAARHRLPAFDGGFDVVVSDCVLSQFVEQIAVALGDTHPLLLPMITQVRRHHLDVMLDLTVPGGYVVLVSDIVSSETAPILHLQGGSPEQLARVMDGLIEAGNFFAGCNPYAIEASCRQDVSLGQRLQTVTLTHPWLWQLRRDRLQLVYGLILQKAHTDHHGTGHEGLRTRGPL